MSRLAKITYALLAFSFVGLGVTHWIAVYYFGGEKQFMQTPIGKFLVLGFTFIWLVTLIALGPASILREKRHMPESKMTIYPWWAWVLLIPYFSHDDNAKVPPWIYIPIFAIGLLLAGALLIIFLAAALFKLFGHS